MTTFIFPPSFKDAAIRVLTLCFLETGKLQDNINVTNGCDAVMSATANECRRSYRP